MIRISKTGWSDEKQAAIEYLKGEHALGLVSFHLDHTDIVFTFYNEEDEAAFILAHGTDFPATPDALQGPGYYVPYIPVHIK